jgi:hypothetical protein
LNHDFQTKTSCLVLRKRTTCNFLVEKLSSCRIEYRSSLVAITNSSGTMCKLRPHPAISVGRRSPLKDLPFCGPDSHLSRIGIGLVKERLTLIGQDTNLGSVARFDASSIIKGSLS